MATPTFGKVDEFDGNKEEWTQYVERLGFFFDANGITDAEKKRAIFLSVVGPSTYRLIKNLVSPAKPGEKSFDQLVEILSGHYNPTPSETIQRHKFNTRERKPGESVATFVAELRAIVEFCDFGSSLDNMLRDRIVCGINNSTIQNRLLAEPKLDFKKAMSLAQGLELAAQNAKELKSSGIPQEPVVHKVTSLGKADGVVCHRCGEKGHKAPTCRFKNATCHKCGKIGHIKKVCRSKGKKGPPGRRYPSRPVHRLEEDQGDEAEEYQLFHFGADNRSPPVKVEVIIDEQPLCMELDTGVAPSIVSEATFKELWPNCVLTPSEVRLRTYSGEAIPVVGSANVCVKYKEQAAQLPLLVVQGTGPSLFGRNWLRVLQLDWQQIHLMRASSLDAVLDRHAAVFKDELGTLQGYKAKIIVDADAQPRFCKARSVPYALRERVEQELTRLTQEGILEPVQFSDWASPIVPVLKSDKVNVRICGDFKQTVNGVAKLDKYPIPKVEDLLSSLAGGKAYTKLDLSQAYQQLLLDDDSKKYVVINTHKGLFQYTRLPFGISSAPGIFQRTMECLLQGIPGVVVYIDDILVSASSETEHLHALDQVLGRLEKAGLRIKRNKCKFMSPSVVYLGYKIDAEGIHPLPDKVQAVVDAPPPKNIHELKSYLGLLSYYAKFMPNLSTVLAPLYRLLRKDVKWHWSSEEEKTFEVSKELLTSSKVLVHFNPKYKLVLACDASAYGVGAVLAHKFEDGTERPIGYASRSLAPAERNYSQLEKEGLACIFGVKRFHSYLYGHPFELITDHKPLLALIGEHRPTSPQASARIKRWSLLLAAYEYTLTFRGTHQHQNADALSRLPLPSGPAQVPTPPELVLLMEHLQDSPVTADDIQVWTRRDPQLARVLQCVRDGWPEQCEADLKPFASRKQELSLHKGCILWGSRVIVPERGQQAVLRELHDGHPGMTKMKSLARMFVWWPGLEKDIESSVQQCSECQESQAHPPAAPLQPWSWPSRPWSRIHIDYAGPLLGRMFLVIIDAHSKWVEVFPTSSATSSATIALLQSTFARFGLPETVVSDNGPCFVSEEFKLFLSRNGIKQVTSAPYHPSSNGLAERAVRILKDGLKKNTTGSLSERVARILIAYRSTPHSTTGVAPAELLLGRRLRTRLDLVRPNLRKGVEDMQLKSKMSHDSSTREKQFTVGDSVYVKNFGQGSKWLAGKVVKLEGSMMFSVQVEGGRMVRRHKDQVRPRFPKQTVPAVSQPSAGDGALTVEVSSFEVSADTGDLSQNSESENETPENVDRSANENTRPVRNRQPPTRFDNSWT